MIPPNTPKWSFLVGIHMGLLGKPTILGNPHIIHVRYLYPHLGVQHLTFSTRRATSLVASKPYSCAFQRTSAVPEASWCAWKHMVVVVPSWSHCWKLTCSFGGYLPWFCLLVSFTWFQLFEKIRHGVFSFMGTVKQLGGQFSSGPQGDSLFLEGHRINTI